MGAWFFFIASDFQVYNFRDQWEEQPHGEQSEIHPGRLTVIQAAILHIHHAQSRMKYA